MGRKALSEGMDSRMLNNACLFYCFPYGDLNALVADMMASDFAAPGVYRQIGRRKNILPFPFIYEVRLFRILSIKNKIKASDLFCFPCF
jgi:hypothetical protein